MRALLTVGVFSIRSNVLDDTPSVDQNVKIIIDEIPSPERNSIIQYLKLSRSVPNIRVAAQYVSLGGFTMGSQSSENANKKKQREKKECLHFNFSFN